MNAVIGLDYGTQAARAVLVDCATGETLARHAVSYAHGVMEGDLASAQDYEDALMELMEAVTPQEYKDSIVGICVDATSLTLVPVTAEGTPLSMLPDLADHPQAQIKLWKRHAAQAQSDEALALAHEMNEKFLGRTGGTISCEWTLPKLLEMRDSAPEVYARMDAALDLCEYLTNRLTGQMTRSVVSLGFKGLWSQDRLFPSEGYLNALRPGFAAEYRHLLRGEAICPSRPAGKLRPELCEKFGLRPDVTVAAGLLDGHTSPAALGGLRKEDAVLVVGTSNVLSVQSEELHDIEGICGIVLDALTPGMYAVDSGQAGTGDMLEWYVKNAVPAQVQAEAEEKGVSVHQVLTSRINRPWENTVVAADWWNGSRNAPCDLSLPGVMMGMTLKTRPEDIYLALLQAIVCGTREILEVCAGYGIKPERMLATGGITGKNPVLMQEYANILHMPVLVGKVEEGPAMGAAILAAVASGVYSTPMEAWEHMGVHDFVTYTPDNEHAEEYEALYRRNHALRQACIALNKEGK